MMRCSSAASPTIIFGAIGFLAIAGVGKACRLFRFWFPQHAARRHGHPQSDSGGGALYYLVSSTLTISAFFMLIELVERGQDAGANVLAVTMEAYGEGEEEEEEEEVGVTMPATMAVLGACFAACGILLAACHRYQASSPSSRCSRQSSTHRSRCQRQRFHALLVDHFPDRLSGFRLTDFR